LSNGRIHGPFTEPLLPNFRCSPFGTATCKRNPKCHVFNHYSWPKDFSVNEETPDEEGKIIYNSFTSAVAALCNSGKGSFLAKMDLKDAYRHILFHSSDWPLLGFHWEGKFYYPIVLMFSGKSAPYIFNVFAEALHWIIQQHIPAVISHYLNEFFPIFGLSTSVQHANKAIDCIEGLAKDLGLSFQPAKTIHPTTHLESLGLELDSQAMEACLPQDKLSYLCTELWTWPSRKHVL